MQAGAGADTCWPAGMLTAAACATGATGRCAGALVTFVAADTGQRGAAGAAGWWRPSCSGRLGGARSGLHGRETGCCAACGCTCNGELEPDAATLLVDTPLPVAALNPQDAPTNPPTGTGSAHAPPGTRTGLLSRTPLARGTAGRNAEAACGRAETCPAAAVARTAALGADTLRSCGSCTCGCGPGIDTGRPSGGRGACTELRAGCAGPATDAATAGAPAGAVTRRTGGGGERWPSAQPARTIAPGWCRLAASP